MLVKDIDKELANKASEVSVKTEVWNGHTIRFVIKEDEYCAVASDVCEALGIENTADALKNMPSPYIAFSYIGGETGVKRDGTPAKQRVRVLTLTELGVYRLIMRSNKPEAEAFRDWVFKMIENFLIKQLRESLGLEG